MPAPKDALLNVARQAKHRSAMWRRHNVEPRIRQVKNVVYAQLEKVAPYKFDAEAYPHHFIRRPSLPTTPDATVNRQIWTAWMSDDDMPPRRVEALESIRRSNPALPITVITPANFGDCMLAEHPFHEGYEYLGPVQKTDYIRCYLLHHYGGVWLDLKATAADWSPYLDRLDADPDLWVAGYPEVSVYYVANELNELGEHLRRHYTKLLGASAYAMKGHSPFTLDWYTEQHARLTYWLEPLRRFPATSAYAIPREHPIGWGEIAYGITHPLSFKHGDHLLLDRRLTPRLSGYR